MPVYKFKSFEEAKKALWNFKPDKEYYKKLYEFYELYSRLYNNKSQQGIFKYKSIEEAESDKRGSR
jgi:hypothetical protein